MSCNCTDCRGYIATQRARTRAEHAIAKAGPEDVNFRPIDWTASELWFGSAKLGYIEQVAVAPTIPMEHSFVITFDDDPANPQTLDTLEEPATVLRDILRLRLHRPPLALAAAE